MSTTHAARINYTIFNIQLHNAAHVPTRNYSDILMVRVLTQLNPLSMRERNRAKQMSGSKGNSLEILYVIRKSILGVSGTKTVSTLKSNDLQAQNPNVWHAISF